MYQGHLITTIGSYVTVVFELKTV